MYKTFLYNRDYMNSASRNLPRQEQEQDYPFSGKEMKLILLVAMSCILSIILTAINDVFLFIIFAIFIYFVCYSSWENCFATYLMLTLWDNRMHLFSTIPLITVLKILLMLKTVLFMRKRFIGRVSDLICLAWFLLYAGITLIESRKIAGISMAMDMLFALIVSAINSKQKVAEPNGLWKKILFVVFVSGMACTLAGFYEYFTGVKIANAYIYGDYYARFRGIVGVNRFCISGCSALLYPLYYMNGFWKKVVSIGFLLVGLLMTISLTAMICLGVMALLYASFQYGGKRRLKILCIGIIVIIYLVYIWNFGSRIGFVNTAVLRVHKFIDKLSEGNYENATSGRTEIVAQYLQMYQQLPFVNKILGTGYTNMYSISGFEHYAHNSYVDMLFFGGVLGCVLLVSRVVRSCTEIYDRETRQAVTLLKVVYGITGFSVSALTADYWLVFMLM